MIVESKLKIDKYRGTATLGHCCETTVSGRMLNLEDIERCLVWHSPIRFEPFARTMSLVRRQARLIKATGVRVSDLTSTLFALGLYAPTEQGWGNPDTVVLVELDRTGQLLRADVLGHPDSDLSEQFHAHKNDLRTADDLRALILSWRYTSILHQLTEGRLQHDGQNAATGGQVRGERSRAVEGAVEESAANRDRKQRAHRANGNSQPNQPMSKRQGKVQSYALKRRAPKPGQAANQAQTKEAA